MPAARRKRVDRMLPSYTSRYGVVRKAWRRRGGEGCLNLARLSRRGLLFVRVGGCRFVRFLRDPLPLAVPDEGLWMKRVSVGRWVRGVSGAGGCRVGPVILSAGSSMHD